MSKAEDLSFMAAVSICSLCYRAVGAYLVVY
jgi:hypothetical protein